MYMLVPCILLVLLFLTMNKNGSYIDQGHSKETLLLEGETKKGTRYFHCGPDGAPNLILLHGARFRKEDWRDSGILGDFCTSNRRVTALDLAVSAPYTDLEAILNELVEQKLVSLPVDIISPSASGKTMVDFIQNGKSSLQSNNYVRWWIPVACPAVKALEPEDFETIKSTFKVLAIYGDQDEPGKENSELLRQVGAPVVELKGSHPVYLDSPIEFIHTVVKYTS